MSDARAVVELEAIAPLLDRFLYALSSFDAEILGTVLASDAVAWRNVGDRTRSGAEVIATMAVERALVRSSTIRVRHKSGTEDGFVVQFVFEGITSGGLAFSLPICIVARVADGRVRSFDEYTDEASLQPLRQEFLAHSVTEAPNDGRAS